MNQSWHRTIVRYSGAVAMIGMVLHGSSEHCRSQEIAATQVSSQRAETTDVFVAGQGGYHTYRIPAIVVSKQGTLLAFCEGRREGGGDAGNIDLLVRRSTDLGQTWSEPQVIWDDGANTCGNPAPVVDQQTGIIWLAMTWNLGSDHEREIMAGTSKQPRLVYLTHSSDDGLTWETPRDISQATRQPHWRWYATGPCNGIQLTQGPHAGRLVIPANHSDHSDESLHPYRSHVIYSDDHGQTWQLGGVEEPKTNESSVVELPGGGLLHFMRSYHGTNRRALATSEDGGATWSSVRLADELDTPVCQASAIRYSWTSTEQPGLILFASPQGKDRARMTVWGSEDDGQTWPIRKLIDAGSSAYSNLVALPDGQVGLLYERENYRKISWLTLDLESLQTSD